MDDSKRYQRLLERYRNGDVDRRTFIGLIGTAGLAYGLSTPFARYAQAAMKPKQVRFDGWGGAVSDAFRKYAANPYEKETGLKVVDGTLCGAEQYLSRVKGSPPG